MREKLKTLPLTTLREMAKNVGIKGVTALRKNELIEALVEANSPKDIVESAPTEERAVKEKSKHPEAKPSPRRENAAAPHIKKRVERPEKNEYQDKAPSHAEHSEPVQDDEKAALKKSLKNMGLPAFAGRVFRSSLTVSRFPHSLAFVQSSGPLRGCSIP